MTVPGPGRSGDLIQGHQQRRVQPAAGRVTAHQRGAHVPFRRLPNSTEKVFECLVKAGFIPGWAGKDG
jgi:hypothetical protein